MKRGFTLVELLAIVIILGVISLICFPVLKSAFSASSQNLLDKQIDSIENIARSWGTTNINKVDKCYILTLEELKKSGLLENKDIVNPKTKKELNGCIKINFDESINQYTYNYTEADLCDCLGS
ncbi:MAG: prepilin-type N-terminal cleavage/methylation domain-containing protein [Firmicutes bacterium]|nr:prepilin-type N-terminal cleavage/methylation domain-containing protein [Bacillota bacterium]